MADILIRGMEMPSCCLMCPMYTISGCRASKKISPDWMNVAAVPKDCPLVPIPERHGRLGDLETAEAILHNKAFDLAGTSAEYNALIWAVRQIKALPTIVPAEGGTDNGDE